MKRFLSNHRLILLLALLAAAQLVVLDWRQGPVEAAPRSWFQVGDNLASVQPLGSDGREASFARGGPTVLLVFHSECGYCEEVADRWRDWTQHIGSGLHTIAVSFEPMASAKAYAAEHGWKTPVWRVDADRLGGPEHALTSRTPWVFVLDDAGVILAEGHGSRIAELGAVLMGRPKEHSGK